MMRRIAAITGLACMLLASGSAHAQQGASECSPESMEAARGHFERAEAFKSREQYAAAVQAYFRAYEICPRPLLVFNAAQAYWLDDKKGEALDLYARYLELAPRGAGATVAYERICDEAEVFFDEQDYDTALPYYQRCAEHDPSSDRAEHARERIADIASAREEARPQAEKAEKARPERAHEQDKAAGVQAPGVMDAEGEAVRDDPFGPRWLPWGVAGSGALVIAVGGVLHRRAVASGDEYDASLVDLCGDSGCRREELPSELSAKLDRAETQQQIAITAYVVGGAALTAGLVWAYLDHASPSSADQETGVTVTPLAGPQELGGVVHIRF